MESALSSFSTNPPTELPGSGILDDTLLNVKPIRCPEYPSMDNDVPNSETECPYSHKKGNISGCPFMNSQNHEPKNRKFDYHYELPLQETARDFYFNRMHYTRETLQKSKWIHTMPNYLRNTLFIKNKKIEEIRTKEYSVVFLIIEDLKEKAHELYKTKKYQSAINAYTLIYSILKWLKFKDEKKAQYNITDISKDNAIIDDDIELHRVATDPNLKYEEDSFKTSVIYVLKSLSYCYLNLRHYTQARKAMEEAIDYAHASKPDVLFRRAQSIMYNKFSSLDDLGKALNDLKEAQELKKKKGDEDDLLNEHIKELSDVIKEKKYTEVGRVKSILDKVDYAYDVITKKKLDVKEKIYASYDDLEFNNKIMHEMKDTYYSSIKFYQDTKNEKELLKLIKEFEKFFDFYLPYDFLFELRASNIPQRILDELSEKDKEIIQSCKINETYRLLFNDFRLKECERLYDDYEWNMSIWKFCFDTVFEREKKEKEKRKKAEGKDKKWNNVLNVNSKVYIIMSVLLFFLSLTFVGFHVMYYSKDNKIK